MPEADSIYLFVCSSIFVVVVVQALKVEKIALRLRVFTIRAFSLNILQRQLSKDSINNNHNDN